MPKILESPSRQQVYDRCPMLYQLTYVDKWEQREAGNSLSARLRGTAFARGVEVLHNCIKAGDTDLLVSKEFQQVAVDTAVGVFNTQYDYCVEQGVVFREGTKEACTSELQRVIPLYALQTPLRTHWKVEHVEFTIEDYSCRPDLAGVTPDGFPFVGDIKYKSSLDSRWENDTIEEYHYSAQFMQYAHAYRQYLGLSDDHTVYSYLFLVVGAPFRIKSVGWVYGPEVHRTWLISAQEVSRDIVLLHEDEIPPRQAMTHRDKFGWCPMYKACFEYHFDPELMQRDYVQLNLPDGGV
jgi:hypothetical protein